MKKYIDWDAIITVVMIIIFGLGYLSYFFNWGNLWTYDSECPEHYVICITKEKREV